jgi:hypothetical protein
METEIERDGGRLLQRSRPFKGCSTAYDDDIGYIFGIDMLIIILNGGAEESDVEGIFRWCYLCQDQ